MLSLSCSHGLSRSKFCTRFLPKKVPPVFWMCNTTITSLPFTSKAREVSLRIPFNIGWSFCSSLVCLSRGLPTWKTVLLEHCWAGQTIITKKNKENTVNTRTKENALFLVFSISDRLPQVCRSHLSSSLANFVLIHISALSMTKIATACLGGSAR